MTNIIHGQFTSELKSRYLTYALSTIMARALPDARDGMKPVHRRILYAMLKLHLEKQYKKSARVVGDVIGKYHPHGDQSVYAAMARLAQDFAVRYPLVDGQGNFGSIDGDNPAAMRYTEARLTKAALWLMKDLEEGTVDFRTNYDESEVEPIVFPACFPNLLANGSSGIAVGLATSIAPHNVGEICDGLQALLKKPSTSDEALLEHIQGPDFPTGGVIVESAASIAEAYRTGKGGIRLRAKWEKEDMGRGQYQIVVTEIPYQVQKSKIIEKIYTLLAEKKLPWLADVADESEDDVRIVLTPKTRTVDAEALMETLFKQTELEIRFSVNMHALNKDGAPELMGLKRLLECFIDHRREVLVRKSKFRLEAIAHRLHILAAYKVVYLNLDEVIEIIKTEDDPAPVLMERFTIDKIQAEAILDMRLRRLRKLDEMEIRKEFDGLSAERDGLQALLADEKLQTKALIEEVKEIKKEFADKRRTSFAEVPAVKIVPLTQQIEREAITVCLSKNGWVKAMKGTITADQEVKFKEGDAEVTRLYGYTTDEVCFVTTNGKAYTISTYKLPTGRGFGEPVNLMVEMKDDAILTAFIPTAPQYLIASAAGNGFIIERDGLFSQTKNGKQIMNLDDGDSVMACVPAQGNLVAVATDDDRLLVFPREDLPVMGRGKGVRLMMVKDAKLKQVAVYVHAAGLGLRGRKGVEKLFVANDLKDWFGKRAQVGKKPPHGFTTGFEFYLPPVDPTTLPLETPPEALPQEKKASVKELVGMLKQGQKSLFDDE